MSRLRNTTFLLIIFLFIVSCKKESVPIEPESKPLNKSIKRGIAFDISSVKDFEEISKGVSWWYNWSPNPNSKAPSNYKTNYKMDFIPMLWGGNTSQTDIALLKNYLNAHPDIQYLLVMNEPNLVDQANRTPQQAASDWLKYESVISDYAAKGRTIYLVGPAMNWGTMSQFNDPIIWLDAFILSYKVANNGREPKIDYLAFHWYDYGLSTQLDRLKKYNKKIWITELANWNSQINSYTKQIAQMKEMVAICESREDVFRYAWFYGRGTYPDNHYTYLFTPNDGELSELGKAYIALPY